MTRTLKISPGVKPFSFILLASALMPYVPGPDWGTGVFVITLLLALVYILATKRIGVPDARTAGAVLFVFLGCVSAINIVYAGKPITDWLRGIAPFLFFLLATCLPKLTQQDKIFLSRRLFVASLLWLARIVVLAVISSLRGSNVFHERLTFDVIDAVIPFPLVLAPYLLFVEKAAKPIWRWSILLVLLYVYVWIGYRAGLLLMLALLVFYFAQSMRQGTRIRSIILASALVALYSYGTVDSFDLEARYSNLDQDASGARNQEWAYAFSQFYESPIFGKGIGWQVPGDVTFYGLETLEGADVSSVGYVHSSLAYMAMTLGLVGVFLYYFVVLPRPFKSGDRAISKFAAIAITLLILFCFTQASFRTIQTVLMIVTLLKLNAESFSLQNSGGSG